MPKAQLEKHIDAPPARTFELFSDLANTPGKVRGIKRVELLTPGPVRKGTRFKETRVMMGREQTEELEVVEFEPGESYALACESGGAYFHCRFTFAPERDGTRVRLELATEARGFFAKLMRPLMGLMFKHCVKACAQDIEDLRAACESR